MRRYTDAQLARFLRDYLNAGHVIRDCGYFYVNDVKVGLVRETAYCPAMSEGFRSAGSWGFYFRHDGKNYVFIDYGKDYHGGGRDHDSWERK